MDSLTTSDGEDGYSILQETRRFLAGLQFEDEHQPELMMVQDGVTPEQSQAYSELVTCVKRINRALASIAKIVKSCETVKPHRKSYLLDQIEHANQHLTEYLYSFRPRE